MTVAEDDREAGERLVRHASALASESAGSDGRVVVLSTIADVAPEVIEACDAASVTLRRGPHLITAAASEEVVRHLDGRQYASGAGPCVDAVGGRVQLHASLDDDGGRWRAFTRAALAEGVQSVLSTPLTVADRPTGALNLYSRTEPSFPVSDRALAQAFATIASTLFDHRDDVVGGWMDAEVRQALARRDVLAQAQGILMARLGIDAQHAFEQLRLDAIEAGVPVAQLAIDVVDESRRRADDHRVDGAFGG